MISVPCLAFVLPLSPHQGKFGDFQDFCYPLQLTPSKAHFSITDLPGEIRIQLSGITATSVSTCLELHSFLTLAAVGPITNLSPS